jgi:hypothetical protein
MWCFFLDSGAKIEGRAFQTKKSRMIYSRGFHSMGHTILDLSLGREGSISGCELARDPTSRPWLKQS